MIKIRLARRGRVHKPIYSIVATDSRSARDGRCLEQLGQYNPSATEVLIDVKIDKIAAWVDKGAVLSDTIKSLFRKNNIKIELKK
ncbi:MAG: 30S ribosomal protein S16 [Bacteriovoracaceae bacterium]|nr:30S ribosomal protein S16 [Bacteriovoracaceae bacterium]